MTATVVPSDAAEPRPDDLRLARLHLRTGLLVLARAELEAAVVGGDLDPDGLVDLAEVRWRTGDLAGAGEAATGAIEAGRATTLAIVVAAEAAMAAGRPVEAHGHVERALAADATGIDAAFAGMPRSPIWPAEGTRHDRPGEAGEDVVPQLRKLSIDAESDLDEARLELDLGRDDDAALRLALVLRAEPHRARVVIDLIGSRRTPHLALVIADAYRIAGDDALADEAWAIARASLVDHPWTALFQQRIKERS